MRENVKIDKIIDKTDKQLKIDKTIPISYLLTDRNFIWFLRLRLFLYLSFNAVINIFIGKFTFPVNFIRGLMDWITDCVTA